MSQHVLITGGNGFIAVHVIVLLLERGYNVTATVRSESKTTYLRKKFASAVNTNQLQFRIVKDITVSGAFDDVIKNNKFDAVLHMSSPVVFNVADVMKDLLLPAINGTTEILKSIKAHGPSVTEEEARTVPGADYRGSKKLAEKAAWDFIENEKPGFDLVYGPALQEVTSLDQLNHSSTAFYAVFSGKDKELKQAPVWIWVDVRDVAKAHLAAIETPEAGNNRFLVSEGTFNMGRLSDFIWANYPERAKAKGIPKSEVKHRGPPEGTYYPDNIKSKTVLGLQYNSFEITLKDTLDQFVALEKELGIE
ncbi:NADPH-dependent methylglyoxal reductase GRE2 protein [Ceratobasidium sp. AG-Ba]|nr:NADPH-dependent methylglyoxal reductase GRE2 protein [Ceratobasidium sp. AG-Ba]